MRQRILGSQTPPCHRRMVITTQFRVSGGGGSRGFFATHGYRPREGHPSLPRPLGKPKMDPLKMLAEMHTKRNTLKFPHSVGHL